MTFASSSGGRFLNVALAVVALLATCAVLGRVLPEPPVENVTPKLRFFDAHKDEFDTLFIGTSHIQHQISPALFDSVTAAAGYPTHSFNFGIDGMHPPESFEVVEKILALRPRKLRHVFFEMEDVQVQWSVHARGTQRLAYWHDWTNTALVLRRAIDPRGDAFWLGKIGRAFLRRRDLLLHLGLFGRQFANVGRGANLMASWSAPSTADLGAEMGVDRDGFLAPNPPMPADRVERYRQKLQREISGRRARRIDPYADKMLRAQAAQFGCRTFFILTPVASQTDLRFRADTPPPGVVLRFNDAQKYPQLYDPAIRADEGHLSPAGAEEFTRLVAGEFLRAVKP